MTSVTKTTELEAVNYMLQSIGESPVSSLTGSSTLDVSYAKDMLNDVSKEVQSMGWSFNTDENYAISPDSNGYITLPSDALMADTVQNSEWKDLVEREYSGSQYLYDRVNNTFKIDETIYVDLVRMFTFEALPEPARQYIKCRASRKFQDKMIGSDTTNKLLKQDEMEALINLKNMEGDVADHNILTGHTDMSLGLLRH